MNSETDLIEKMFTALEKKELSACLKLFDENAMLYDPHYPLSRMQGKEDIKNGLLWSFSTMKKFNFEVARVFKSDEGDVAVEVNSSHELPGGKQLIFNQMFIFEIDNNLIKAIIAYEPYGPGGLTGIMLAINHFFVRLFKRV